ncbi:MAG: hypothetical protein II038_06720 [Lachnospiraceae bacterium]|nr:hypothetical protein [Lachnospiraceae bacterium]
MSGYWVRHRLLPTLVLCVAVGLVSSLLFAFPYVNQQANTYNSQSIYKNSDVDFIAPEPSFDQVQELPGTNGIDKVFPFYLTKTSVNVNGSSRTTTVLLSDKFDNVDFTMYNSQRLIEKSSSEFDNPILVDWKFCHDTSSKIGDTVTFTLGGNNVEYRIYAIYETNSVYDGGAILAQISDEQKNAIQQNSNNNGYSGMYVMASDYSACKSYLTSEYRPLGRLKSRDQFEDDDQYQIHYDAIMSSGFANEITDFRVKESGLDKKISPLMVLIGAALSLVLIIAFNIVMSKRGCERVYFQKHCIPKGQNVKPYYNTAFVFEIISFVVIYVVGIIVKTCLSDSYIPKSTYDYWLVLIPVAVIVAEIISLIMNYSVVAGIAKKVKEEQKKKEGNYH